MAIFHSNISALCITMKVGEHNRYFRFTPKGKPYNYGYLYVKDPEEVAAIKRHPYFGKSIWVPEVDVPAEPETKTATYIKEYPDVTKTQDAKQILKDEYLIDVENIRSKAQALAAAKELNISFPNL